MSSSFRASASTEMDAAFLERWLEDVLATPGLTSLETLDDARRVLLEDALRALSVVESSDGAVVDVGSGGGSPGVPLAATLRERSFTLLESQRRKAEFLARTAQGLANVEVVWGRAEEEPLDEYGVALAKALARPPVAAELCLPLVRPGGIAVLWVGETAEPKQVATAAERVGGALESDSDGLVVLRKLVPTPPGFPRRPGMAKKRPLG
jgi:16S rRNA (guanine527-N7)-methyltransferase